MIGEDHPASQEALAAFGKTTLRNIRLENDVQSLKCCIDQLRLELHHKAIEITALKEHRIQLIEKYAKLSEKAETQIMPIVVKPEDQILDVDEYDLSVDVNVKRGNDPLIL